LVLLVVSGCGCVYLFLDECIVNVLIVFVQRSVSVIQDCSLRMGDVCVWFSGLFGMFVVTFASHLRLGSNSPGLFAPHM
jgi:hypothetical protein